MITLKAARVNSQLNQKQAANLIGISVSALQKYESGKSFPNVPVIKKIETVYGIPFDKIFFKQK